MERLLRIALASAAVVAGTAELSAQGTPGEAPRPFKRLFAEPTSPPPGIDLGPRQLQVLPSVTRCDIVVVPADPRLDPRMVIAPPDPQRFTMRLVPTDRFCRSR